MLFACLGRHFAFVRRCDLHLSGSMIMSIERDFGRGLVLVGTEINHMTKTIGESRFGHRSADRQIEYVLLRMM